MASGTIKNTNEIVNLELTDVPSTATARVKVLTETLDTFENHDEIISHAVTE